MMKQADKDVILGLIKEGLPFDTVVMRSGYCEQTVKRLMKKNDVVCHRPVKRSDWPKKAKKAMELRCQGVSWTNVAELVGYKNGASASASVWLYENRVLKKKGC